jgi:hypothetical protein
MATHTVHVHLIVELPEGLDPDLPLRVYDHSESNFYIWDYRKGANRDPGGLDLAVTLHLQGPKDRRPGGEDPKVVRGWVD